LRNFLNSAVYATGAALLTLLVAVPCGYAAARLRFWGKDAILLAMLATSMIPGVALLIPLFYLFDRGGLVNNVVAIMVVYSATFIPQAIWFMRVFVATVPEAVEEAALIDGCSRLQALVRVTLPLVAPGLGALIVLGFISVWNDYVYVAALTRDQSLQTVQVALVNQVFESVGISWSVLSAFITLATLPILALFILVQRWFVMGLSAGGVKG